MRFLTPSRARAGPVPAYNGPCQCKACFAIFRRLRSFMFEWGFFGPKEINEQIDDRFCFGERCAAAALAHHVLARRTPSWHARHTGAPREQPAAPTRVLSRVRHSWQQRSECYFLLGNYRDLITTMLYFGMEPQSMCRMLFQCA